MPNSRRTGQTTRKAGVSVNASSFFVSEELIEDYDNENLGASAYGPVAGRRTVDEVRDLRKLVCLETTGLRFWRTVVVLLLLATGCFIAVFTYNFLRNGEYDRFDKTYTLFAERTRSTSEVYFKNLIVSFQELSDLITAAGLKSPTPFPLVKVDNFEVAGYHARVASGVEEILYSPIVPAKDLDAWNNFSIQNAGWIQEGRTYLKNLPAFTSPGVPGLLGARTDNPKDTITPFIWREDALQNPVKSNPPPYLPVWQSSPPVHSARFVNYDILKEPIFAALFQTAVVVKEAIISDFFQIDRYKNVVVGASQHQAYHDNSFGNTSKFSSWDHPHSVVLQPVFAKLKDSSSQIVGVVQSVIAWDYLVQILGTQGSSGIYAVLSNSCGNSFTYKLGMKYATFLGEGDLHEAAWNHEKVVVPFNFYQNNNTAYVSGHCVYTMTIYPSNEMRSKWDQNVPLIFAYAIAATFFLVIVSFFVYDALVHRRNEALVQTAARNNKLVSQLFPSNVRDRVLDDVAAGSKNVEQGTQTRLKNFLANDFAPDADDMETDELMYKTKPIADLFPETTILFADIAGFTAWSSAREPSQVFTLLETVYRAFDMSAQRRRIFKVETVGDCYVAATGIPEPRIDHAVAMARFAKECMVKFQALTRRLEVSLGPDTADLSTRMGIHSGPVTAGVLRGERSRFQLFGDTMNTASRMESTGIRDKIQISQETADLLYAAGKADWIVPRDDLVVAKGKGQLKTYWLEITLHEGASVTSGESSEDEESLGEIEPEELPPVVVQPQDVVFSDKVQRLIEWNVELLHRLLHSVVIRRQGHPPTGPPPDEKVFMTKSNTTVFDEVQEIIVLPEFEDNGDMSERKAVVLDPIVEEQLTKYVSGVASMYRNNPFHNFEHASHVTMSVAKLLSRIVAPSHLDLQDSITKDLTLHDHTYGITSDPLTQFACVFSALIHDVDHTGVPNTQLIKENAKIAEYYKRKSVAEQNSVDVSWDMLMQGDFAELRSTIYTTHDEMKRFRQLVVNCVMATDIMDKELKELRNARWDRAFSEQAAQNANERATINRKATIVIEHLLQASDVAHTMQHWHIYRKWNSKLFEELYKAYKEGRSEKSPADFWYKGEIGFFDFYIIPLAKKLKDCGVFGVSSKEYLNYAEKNRSEWEARGQEVLSELLEHVKKIYDGESSASTIDVSIPSIPEAAPKSPGAVRAPHSNSVVEAGSLDTRSGHNPLSKSVKESLPKLL